LQQTARILKLAFAAATPRMQGANTPSDFFWVIHWVFLPAVHIGIRREDYKGGALQALQTYAFKSCIKSSN
jgi:hypothetical protein